MKKKWFDVNRAMWDERVPIHVASGFYDVDAFRAHPERVRPFEANEVGDVTGKSLVHLQCHFGLDTLAWAARGARVVGLDFSAPAVAAAGDLATEMDLDAKFVAANVYDAVTALRGRKFDIVYTGMGALNWLPDIDAWASIVASLLRRGGFLYLSEFHPITWSFDWHELRVETDYFDDQPRYDDEPGTYVDFDAATESNAAYEWQHTLGDVVTAVVNAGLRIEFLHEHPFTYYSRWPWLVETDEGDFRMPGDRPALPLVYSLRARK